MSTAGYEHLVPFIHQPDNMVPGVSVWYATSCRECPAGCGMLLRSREARVVKCEGNREHPINQGALCARGQAALHGLYDPDRTRGPLRRGKKGFDPVTWENALAALGQTLRYKRGRVAIMTDLQTGSLQELMREWLSALGSDRLIVYEPINYEAVKAAAGGVVPSFNIAKSDYLISFGADFLETWISPIQYARQFATMRQMRNGSRGRFVYVGPRVSMTAANADERILVSPGKEGLVALLIASEIGAPVPQGFSARAALIELQLDYEQIRRIARGFGAASSPLALPGVGAESARAAMSLNAARGSTLVNTNRPHALTNLARMSEVRDFISAMDDGEIDVLLIYGANPVYSLPKSAGFVEALKKVQTVISLSSFFDETTAVSHWAMPSNTPLESWGDYEPEAGIANLMQPTMGKLFDTRQTGDTLMSLARAAGVDLRATFNAENFYEYLRRRWGFPLPAGVGPEASTPEWEGLLQQGGRWPTIETGVIAGGPVSVATPAEGIEGLEVSGPGVAIAKPESSDLVLHAFPHIYYYDGRNANRRWLQEMPEPVTKAVWGSWAELHPDTAKELGVKTDDVVTITRGDVTIAVPVFVWKGVMPGVVAMPVGEGHESYGRYASGVGVNVWPLLETNSPLVRVTGSAIRTSVIRRHGATSQHGRHIARTTAMGESSKREVTLPLPKGYKFSDFYPGHEHSPNRWAMVVDLDRCTGCHACVVACYAENNIPVVGPDGVRRRRDMQWLRIDPYIDWSRESAPVIFQPMLCQHCDAAPCEPVCPVFAAAHSEDGINMQVYNRCVGTRYCSNNCPYKVRRFNWFHYDWPEPLNYQLNPDVTVRDRGVMEKCTFCVQRIREARIVAMREGRPISDEEVTPACVQTCPTGVYTFGDLMNPKSKVSKIIRENPRAYQVLHELNTKPAVIYLKRVVEKH